MPAKLICFETDTYKGCFDCNMERTLNKWESTSNYLEALFEIWLL